jgi:hypothetical protein
MINALGLLTIFIIGFVKVFHFRSSVVKEIKYWESK